jgi:hypothetical protein
MAHNAVCHLLTNRIHPDILTLEDKKEKGDERDKYLLLHGRELRAGATQQQAEAKSTREPAR